MKRNIFEEEHLIFRESVRAFVKSEIVPFHEQWEEDRHGPARAVAQGRQDRLPAASTCPRSTAARASTISATTSS